jgi:hypothetical protein
MRALTLLSRAALQVLGPPQIITCNEGGQRALRQAVERSHTVHTHTADTATAARASPDVLVPGYGSYELYQQSPATRVVRERLETSFERSHTVHTPFTHDD